MQVDSVNGMHKKPGNSILICKYLLPLIVIGGIWIKRLAILWFQSSSQFWKVSITTEAISCAKIDSQRDNVTSTSMQCLDVASTLVWRCINDMCKLFPFKIERFPAGRQNNWHSWSPEPKSLSFPFKYMTSEPRLSGQVFCISHFSEKKRKKKFHLRVWWVGLLVSGWTV